MRRDARPLERLELRLRHLDADRQQARVHTPAPSPGAPRPCRRRPRGRPPRRRRPARRAWCGRRARRRGEVPAAASRWAGPISEAARVMTTRRPAVRSARTTRRPAVTGQRRSPLAAPGCTSVAPAQRPSAADGGRAQRAGRIGGDAGCSSSRHQRATSCSSARQGGPSSARRRANAISRRGRRPRAARWLCGPRPWRFTAMSAPGAAAGSAPAPADAVTSSAS